jgi:hypothetical protein
MEECYSLDARGQATKKRDEYEKPTSGSELVNCLTVDKVDTPCNEQEKTLISVIYTGDGWKQAGR